MASFATPAFADSFRFATYNVELRRDGPGLLLRDILKGDDNAVRLAAHRIGEARPHVLLLTGFDYDHGLAALTAFNGTLADPFPHLFAWRPNTGRTTGLDLDDDGLLGGAADRQGYGAFSGQNGMALLSRFPILAEAGQDHSDLLWRELPGATLPYTYGAAEAETMRLASVGLWDVVVALPGVGRVHVFGFHATPPVFDGPEDRNGLRNRDELRFWALYMDGALGAPPEDPFILLGDANADPVDGEARRDGLAALLGHRRVQDPVPESLGAVLASEKDGGANTRHKGDPARDTADWRDDGPGPGNLRVDYALPSTDWEVTGAGVLWPAPENDSVASLRGDDTAALPTRHRLVWVDVRPKRGGDGLLNRGLAEVGQ